MRISAQEGTKQWSEQGICVRLTRVKSCLVTLKDKFEKGPLQEIKTIKAVTQVSN